MKMTFCAAVAALLLGPLGAAEAATLTGTFAVTVVNVTNLDSAQSQASKSNFDTAIAHSGNPNTAFGTNSVATYDTFTYTGALDFATRNGNATTIAQWLDSNVPGTYSGLNIGNLQLSKSNIGNGTATTTFFWFSLLGSLGAADFTVNHDDGVAVFDDGVRIGGLLGPNSLATTKVNGFNGGKFDLLYVATNNDPSVLKVTSPSDLTVAPVPLPAPFALLAAGMAVLGAVGLRRKAA